MWNLLDQEQQTHTHTQKKEEKKRAKICFWNKTWTAIRMQKSYAAFYLQWAYKQTSNSRQITNEQHIRRPTKRERNKSANTHHYQKKERKETGQSIQLLGDGSQAGKSFGLVAVRPAANRCYFISNISQDTKLSQGKENVRMKMRLSFTWRFRTRSRVFLHTSKQAAKI